MKMIKITHPHHLAKQNVPKSVMALGFFDGVHKGHQKVIQTAKQKAEELNVECAVMTFDPHPSIVLKKNIQQIEYITPLQEKLKFIEDLGIDRLYLVEFTESFSSLQPQQFVDQYIIGLNAIHVVAGFDFTFGRFGKGTMETLPFYSRGAFTHTTVEKLTDGERKISSSLVRNAIKNGDVSYACSLLGRPHQVSGKVIHGEKRGRTIGFPTANIELSESYITPPTGVYAVKISMNGKEYAGICNIGYKPTFHEKRPDKPSIEVHIFDFHEEIYDIDVTVKWFKRIRSEQKFSGVEELIAQIKRDIKEAKDFFQQLTESDKITAEKNF